MNCNRYRLCVLIHFILHSSTHGLLLSVISHFVHSAVIIDRDQPVQFHFREHWHLSLFYTSSPLRSIHLPDLQVTPRSDPVTLLTLFSLLLHFILFSHNAQSSLSLSPPSLATSLSLSLSGKSCDFSEAEPYKPAVLGGLCLYSSLIGSYIQMLLHCCLVHTRTHKHSGPPVFFFQEQM